MIAQLTGKVVEHSPSTLVLDVSGVGYLLHVTPRFSLGVKVGSVVTCATHLVVREDSMTLYGFENAAARELFELLLTVSGIGPKVAQSALSVYDPGELTSLIAHENQALLEKIPGLGKKGVSRLLLELKGKVLPTGTPASVAVSEGWSEQLIMALIGLGFTARDAQNRVDLLNREYPQAATMEIAELLRAALAMGEAR